MEGCCLLAMIAQSRDETGFAPDIFNLDTGYQFPETLELRERLQARYGLSMRLVSATETIEHMEARFGGPIYGTNPDHCCYLRTVVPLQAAVQGFDAWLTAIRRDQMGRHGEARMWLTSVRAWPATVCLEFVGQIQTYRARLHEMKMHVRYSLGWFTRQA